MHYLLDPSVHLLMRHDLIHHDHDCHRKDYRHHNRKFPHQTRASNKLLELHF